MRNLIFLLSVILVAMISTMATDKKDAAAEKAAGEPKKATLSAFDWMLGSWTLTNNQGVTTESWVKLGETMYRGRSVTMKGNDTSFFERLLLVHDSIGIAYIALPKQNTEPTRFSLSVWDKNRAIFENPTHDFPKAIIYEFREPDTLHARIEGPGKDGKTKGIDFVFTRAKP